MKTFGIRSCDRLLFMEHPILFTIFLLTGDVVALHISKVEVKMRKSQIIQSSCNGDHPKCIHGKCYHVLCVLYKVIWDKTITPPNPTHMNRVLESKEIVLAAARLANKRTKQENKHLETLCQNFQAKFGVDPHHLIPDFEDIDGKDDDEEEEVVDNGETSEGTHPDYHCIDEVCPDEVWEGFNSDDEKSEEEEEEDDDDDDDEKREAAYVCKQCKSSFKRPRYLHQHEKIHSSVNLKCPHCIFSTTTRSYLNKHIKKYHS